MPIPRESPEPGPVSLETFEAGREAPRGTSGAFLPARVNRPWSWQDPRIHTLLEEASLALGALDAYSRIVPDVGLYTRLFATKEANASTRIEGTRTQMEEAVQGSAEEVAEGRREDWREVQSYIRATRWGIEKLGSLPLSLRLMRGVHRELMQGERGQNKAPGEFRRVQNWIGGATAEDAAYVPPAPQHVTELMGDLEAFWHNEDVLVPCLVRAAISHYQFETIHPFLDGNGRAGRLFVTLYLISEGVLQKPSLLLSVHLETHRQAYFDSLARARTPGGIEQWVRFFLVAVREASRKGAETFESILALRERVEKRVLTLGQRAGNARRLLGLLYEEPVTSANQAAEHLGVTFRTAMRLIEALEELGILVETTGKQRDRRYRFEAYFQLFA